MNDTIREIPEEQRPYEKCFRLGPGALSDSELLAVILRTGTYGMSSLALSNSVLKHMEKGAFPGLIGIIHSSVQDLMEIHGIGRVKAIQLKCIGELSIRIATSAAKEALDFRDPFTIANYYMERLRHEEQEQMIVMMLDTKNHLIGEQMITRGTVNMTVITPREIFVEALQHRAVSVILVHNHPSGDPTPSTHDIQVTDRVQQAGDMLGIHLLDHIVIGNHRYFSFLEERMLKRTS
ncbi:MAG: DNA repair protein RadC [Clostridiales bacterium]|nr:DNA repair protein RadC [Candidatus Blautia equi]